MPSAPSAHIPSETVTGNLDRPFAVAGRRSFLIGHQNGSFPDLGHHLPGEMGGLWAPPVKLADGFWFGLRGAGAADWSWLQHTTFTMTPTGAVSQSSVTLPAGEVGCRQQVMMAAHDPALLVSLELHNPGEGVVELDCAWLVRFEVRPAWWSEWPDAPDVAQVVDGLVVVRDQQTPRWAAVAASATPCTITTGDLWGPERTGCLRGSDDRPEGILRRPEVLEGAGVSAQFTQRVVIGPGATTTLHFVLAGGHDVGDDAAVWARDLLARQADLQHQKQGEQASLLARSPRVSAPVAEWTTVVDGSVMALDLLTQDMPGVGLGLMAGLQGFAWYFGCDTYYSVSGLLVANQAETARATLRLLADHGRQQRGRIPHEIVQSGELFNPGNQIETAEFPTSVERFFRWTGDRGFLDEVYPVVVAGIFDFLLTDSDPEGTLLPEGPGILELSTAQRGRKLDVAAGLFQGLGSLAWLASVVGDTETEQRCRDLQPRVREQIEAHFWDASVGDYVWRIEHDLSIRPGEPGHGLVNLEFGVVDDAARASAMFELIEAETGTRGVMVPGSSDFVMAIQNAIVAHAHFRYNRPDDGVRFLQCCADEYGHYMPWAIPEFIGHDSCFLQAWSSATFVWLAVQGCFRLLPDPTTGVVEVRPQLPREWPSLTVRNLTLWGTSHDLTLTREADGSISFAATVNTTEPDARPASFEVRDASQVPVHYV